MQNEYILVFKVFYEYDDYKEMLEFINIPFDVYTYKGDKKKGYGYVSKNHEFEIEIREKNEFSAINKMFKKLSKYKKKIISTKKNRKVEYQLSFVIYSYNANFGFHLSVEHIEFLQEIGTSFDCDIYSLKKE